MSLALSLLRCVDNPLLDIPLAAVLLSPIYGFTPGDLARVRLSDRHSCLYLAVQNAAREDERLAAFLHELAEFRGLAAALPSNRLLAELYDNTKLPELVQAMDSSIEVESLQKVICQGSSEGVSLMERVEQGHDEQEELLRRMLLEELLSSLEPRERRLIVLRFFYDRTQTQVAMELGMSQVQVSRLEKKILSALKEKM